MVARGTSWELVPELLFQDVPDHAFGLSAQHIEGIRLNFGVRRGLERQQTYLWSIAMGRTSSCLLATAARAGAADRTFARCFSCHRLATLQQCIAAQSDHHAHVCLRTQTSV